MAFAVWQKGKAMDELIYRQDAANIICDWCDICSKEERDIMHCDDVCPQFARIPSAQKKGHWVENHDSDHAWKCSECGCGYTDSKLSFCYDCGADMRGEADGENS